MSETMSSQRKPSVNKNIKKLRTLSAVCNLARSWQQWICENEEKQSNEPAGWAPDSIDQGTTEKEPKKPVFIDKKIKTSKDNEDKPEDSRIKTIQVVKTVTRDAQEKGAGIEFLTNRICKDPEEEDLDRKLKNRSPTLRRKCSNMVSELKQGWKVAENDQIKVGDSSEGSETSEANEQVLEIGTSKNQDNAENDSDSSSSIRLKRPSSIG